MKNIKGILVLFVLASLILSACGATPTPPVIINPEPGPTDIPVELEPTAVVDEDVLYLNLLWHQHQPLYYQDENGVYTRPWVRAHATKDYYDMAAILKDYPDVQVTFNLTPVLIKQLNDFTLNGAIDRYWELALIPAAELSPEDKEFILSRFFDVNWDHIISRFPRYQALLDQRGGTDAQAITDAMETFSDQDFLDLQVWFNLAWIDPDFLAVSPLKELVEKGRDFSEADKTVLFAEVEKVIAGVIPLHKEMQESGQIEVITTPYAHPILPLIIDSNLATVGNPSAETPQRFSYPTDAVAHLQRSVEIYEQNFGVKPAGLWPGEGSVAQIMVPFVLRAGYQWMASGEPVLAKSLGLDAFTRDSKETVREADLLYRPYYVTNQDGAKLAVFFRDGVISDKLGFTYSGVSGSAAAQDLMTRLENIRAQLAAENAQGPHIVSIILDGENAWENYENDGKEFFHAFYQLLSESTTIESITPSRYLEMFPEQRMIEDLFPGAWFSPNYDTWIGEPEETMAWEYLRKTRETLARYDISKTRQTSEEQLQQAQDYMYLAEGSDWFWWYGADQDSGQDSYFDEGFRALLRNVFTSLGETVPSFVDTPIIQARPVSADEPTQGMSTPVIDGVLADGEWANAGVYYGKGELSESRLSFTLDASNAYFLLEQPTLAEDASIDFYFKSSKLLGGFPYAFAEEGNGVLLGSAMNNLLRWSAAGVAGFTAGDTAWNAAETGARAVRSGNALELSVPLSIFGELETGDQIQFIVLNENKQRIPLEGPGQIILPDLGLSTLLFEVEDPEGDDHGPGSYTYPTDAVFIGKSYDLKSFKISEDANNFIFKVDFFGPIQNPWGSPNNLAIQTIDIYIDFDPGAGSGARKLLPGRNLSLAATDGWDYALWLEGWTPQVLAPAADTLEPLQITDADYRLIVDPAGCSVTVRIPKTQFLQTDIQNWGFAVLVLGQEGYPSTGVWRVRDVEAQNAQWRFGGAPADSNHTRVIDIIWAAGEAVSQEDMLSSYTSSTLDAGSLSADDYGIIQLLLIE